MKRDFEEAAVTLSHFFQALFHSAVLIITQAIIMSWVFFSFLSETRALHTDIPSHPGCAVQEASSASLIQSRDKHDESQCKNGDKGE